MAPEALQRLTSVERAMGFIEAFVAGDDEFAYHPTFVEAVILPLRPGLRIVKIKTPWNQWVYQVRVFGRYALGPFTNQLPPKWNPVSNTMPTPELALAAADGSLDPVISGATRVIEAEESSIMLACPKCGETFEVNEDHLPVDYVAKCPYCHGSSPVQECQARF